MNIRFKSILICLVMLLNILSGISTVFAITNNEGSVSLGKSVKSSGVTVETDDNNKMPVIVKDGIEGWEMSSETHSRNLNFNVDNSLIFRNNGEKCVEIEVTYYDEGTGRFALIYDSIFKANTEFDDYVFLTDGGGWRTHTFVLTDAYFGGRCNNSYDFCIKLHTDVMGGSPTNIIFSQVKVKICDFKQKVKLDIENGALGGIFFTGEKPFVNLSVGSMSVRRSKIDFYYTLYDKDGNVCWTDSKNDYTVSFNPKIIQVYPEIDRYGIYVLKVEAKDKTGNVYSVAEREISYVNSDGKTLNEDMGVSARYANKSWYVPEDIIKSQRLVKMAGFGYVRTEESWAASEPTSKGNYVITPLYDAVVRGANDNGTETLIIAAFGNPLYGLSDKGFPYTEEQLEGWYNYCYNLVKKSKGAIKCLEIWNEPNASNFNTDNRTPEDYVKVLEAGYKAAKAADPDIIVAGMSITGLNLEWVTRILKAGGGEYMDCFAVHPYSFSSSPIKGGIERKISSYRDAFIECGYGDMPFWVTEMGWASGLQDNITEIEQANFNVQNYITLKGLGIEKFTTFTLHDKGVSNGSKIFDRQDTFGMIRYFPKGGETSDEIPNVWSAKPSYLAISNMNMHLADCDYNEHKIIDDDIYLYKFKRNSDNKTVYTMWNENHNSQLSLKSSSTDIKIYDMYGNLIPLVPVDGVYSFITDNSVLYIEGNDFTLEKAEDVFKVDKVDFKATQNEEVSIGINTSQPGEFDIFFNSKDENAKFVNCENIKNGKGNIKFSSGEGIIGDYEYAGFEIRKDDKLYMTGKVKCEYIRLTECEFGSQLSSLNNYNRWTGYVDITNNRSEMPISGVLTVTEPSFAAKTVNNLEIPPIAPGETKRVPFYLPEIFRKGTYNVSAVANWSTGDVQNIAGKLNFTVAPYADVKPQIDGVISEDEWVFGAQMILSEQSQVRDLDGFKWMGPDDLNARVAVEWDEDNLYICVVAHDDVFFKSAADVGRYIYRGDTFQFAISYEKGMGLTNSTDIYTNIGVSMTDGGELVYVYAGEELTIKVGKNNDCPCKITRDGETTTYEIALPWSQIISTTVDIKAGDTLAFTMLLNDNDGFGRKGWLEYTKGLGENANSNHFSTLTLLPSKNK